MTGRYLAEHPLDRQLQLLGADTPAERRMETIWSYYEEVTGDQLERPPVRAERQRVVGWLRERMVSDDCITLFANWPVLQAAAHQTMTEKASTVRQLRCLACEIQVREDGTIPMSLRFGLDVTPWTAQSAPDRVKIREAVTAKMREKRIYEPTDQPVCISVVSLIPNGVGGIKDVDNLVKGLLDSFEGLIYVNDRQIQCLTSRRINYNGNKGAYFVNANAVRPWGDDVIVDDGVPMAFL